MRYFFNAPKSLEKFLTIVANELGIENDPSGTTLDISLKEGPIKVWSTENKVSIQAQEKSHLFRAITIWWNRRNEGDFQFEEQPNFNQIGPLFDCSRNAVIRPEKLKRLLLLCGKMGLNTAMIYMEDTYEIPEYPYFGYLRGRYSQEELRDIDQYANSIGIELVPSIQTLAHLSNPLKWSSFGNIKDTEDILLVGEEETYQFISAAIRSLSSCFTSKKIHIGMDEAHNLGRGTYLDLNGLRDRFKIMEDHLTRVTEICFQNKLDPMMWSDMYFRIGSQSGDYYDKNIDFPKAIIKNLPDVKMFYWDYYHSNKEDYLIGFENHQKLLKPILFAGGIWTWNGLAPNYGKTFSTSIPALEAARESKIDTIYATMWGDDGAETPLISGLLGLQLFAEAQFSPELTFDSTVEKFRLFHNLNASDFLLLNDFDQTEGIAKDNPDASNPSKLSLYSDLMFGLYNEDLKGNNLAEHYRHLANQLTTVTPNSDTIETFQHYMQLAKTLSLKNDITEKLPELYQTRNLKDILPALEQLTIELENLKNSHRDVWFAWNKAFGFEILDLRYGAIQNRCKTTIWRIKEYLSGSISNLEELEIPKLVFDSTRDRSTSHGSNLFRGIFSPSKISDM